MYFYYYFERWAPDPHKNCSQSMEGCLYAIVLFRHFLPSLLARSYCKRWLDALNNAWGHRAVDVLSTSLPDMTHNTGVDIFARSGNTNTPGAAQLTATLSHILYNTWDTGAPFVVSTHTLLTLAHGCNLTRETHTSCRSHVCLLLVGRVELRVELSLLFRQRCQHPNKWANIVAMDEWEKGTERLMEWWNVEKRHYGGEEKKTTWKWSENVPIL